VHISPCLAPEDKRIEVGIIGIWQEGDALAGEKLWQNNSTGIPSSPEEHPSSSRNPNSLQ